MFHRKWTKITGDQWVLETLLEGLKLEFMSHPCLNIKETSVPRYGIHESVILTEISVLLEKNVIEHVPVGQENLGYYSTVFRSSKTTRRFATDSQSETSKPNSSASSFQDGNTPFNYESFKKGRLCSNFGFSRCIFSYPNSHRLQTIPEIPISRSQLPISSNAIRAQICPKSVHKDHGCISSIPTKVNDSDIHVSRRLADQQFRQNSSCKANAFCTPSSSRFGTYSKSEKVKLNTNPTYRILGSPFQSRERDSNTNRDKISKYFGNNTCITKQSTDSSSSNFKITRSDGFMHLPNTHGKITYEANPTLFVSTMEAKHPTIESVHSCTNELDSTFKMVDKSDKYFQRNAFTGADNSVDIDHRCLRTRMGSSSRNLADIRNMAKVLSTKTYKLVGIEGCTVSSSRSCTDRERHEYFDKVGQYNSDKLYQQAGRNPFARTVLPNLGPLPMVYSEQSNYPCSSHSGKDKSTSRCSFEGEKSFQDDRVDTQQYDSKYDISETGNSKYRSVCNSSEQKMMDISDLKKNGIKLLPNMQFLAKTQTLNRPWEPLFIPSFNSYATDSEDLKLCPCRALRIYINRTKSIRKSNRLFVTYKKNHHKEASKDSIARWIVNTVRYAYENADKDTLKTVRAHDTRRLSTSWALFCGVSAEEILKAVHWTSETTFTSFYLKDVPDHQSIFAKSAILDSFKRGRQK
ncbi:Hypothetical predicted protein [Mytilus galloprovincialis]|uniref:Tyr recombinase domain-containing protein n=1 Tax=Mytilus galloprovincialis TaxID=29158 RepID=A0A8B6BW33_MYTGA|nr:Hypothetical predicted protein [Mytilus galloprovincialis]